MKDDFKLTINLDMDTYKLYKESWKEYNALAPNPKKWGDWISNIINELLLERIIK